MSEATRYWLENRRRKVEARGGAMTGRELALFEAMAAVSITRHESAHTAATYGAAVVEFFRWLKGKPEVHAESSEEKVAGYLSAIAPRVAAKTQNQKLCALNRFYREVLKRPLGDLPRWVYAKVARRLPVCLGVDEMRRMLGLIDGTAGLMARLAYGAGLRLMEVTSLRVQHVDLEQRLVRVCGGKGDKDRVVPLAACLVEPMREHLGRVHALWESDVARGLPPVMLPAGLERKYPNAGREWPWFWVFPGRDLSRDPATGVVRRHHVHRNCLGKVVASAARRAAIRKRVTVHALRHSFATHQLMRGVNIRQVQELLGHNSLETTQIYLHCLPNEINGAGSPLDALVA